ncbi:MAG: hypothetical protein ACK4M3_08200 [Pyrobaculum sp.]
MQFLARLAKTVERLDKAAQRCQDEELRDLVKEIYRQLSVLINVLEKVYTIYSELDVLVKTDLKLDVGLYLDVEIPRQERLADYIQKVREAGQDPDRVVAYLLSTRLAKIQVREGELYIVGDQRY